MPTMDRRERAPVAVVLAAVVLAAVAAYVVGIALSASRLGRVDGLIAGGATVVAGFALLWTWASAAAKARETDGAREAERAYSRELRERVSEMHRERGPLADPRSVSELVLRTATRMLEAEKGLLLSRRDADGDGDLDLIAAEGFERDPSDSRLVQRFASEVIERDTTVREDKPRAGDEGGKADEEIHNLVAIPIYVRDEFDGVVVCANRKGGFEDQDDQILLALGDHAGAVLDGAQLRGELRRAYLSTVAMLAEALEAKDPFLRGHSEEVAHYVRVVGERFDFEPDHREALIFASLLHDVGKLGISEQILMKPGPLTEEERAIVNLHPRIGSRLVQQVPALAPMTRAILHHHERYDGGGYPVRLKGEQIPLEARIICVADSFSAMIAERPYRRRMTTDDACAELERCAGTQFDPAVVQAFVEAVRTNPPEHERGALAAALEDPEVEGHRDGQSLLGLSELGMTDSLTMLYSHSHFHTVARAEAERSEVQGAPFAVVMFELTRLGEVNRRDGYAAGDAALRSVARVVSGAADRCGGTAARHGGRRLALIVPGAGVDHARRLAAEIEEQVRAHAAVRSQAAAWRPGDRGDDVTARAWRALRGDPATVPAAGSEPAPAWMLS